MISLLVKCCKPRVTSWISRHRDCSLPHPKQTFVLNKRNNPQKRFVNKSNTVEIMPYYLHEGRCTNFRKLLSFLLSKYWKRASFVKQTTFSSVFSIDWAAETIEESKLGLFGYEEVPLWEIWRKWYAAIARQTLGN